MSDRSVGTQDATDVSMLYSRYLGRLIAASTLFAGSLATACAAPVGDSSSVTEEALQTAPVLSSVPAHGVVMLKVIAQPH